MSRPRVGVAISSFRNDEQVVGLLRSLLTSEVRAFYRIIVVDSQGTGIVPAAISQEGWADAVVYENHTTNLGSAGNLARRLQLAHGLGCDYVYAVNHDAKVNVAVVSKLAETAEAIGQVGAVYPLRYKTSRQKYDLSGTRLFRLWFGGTSAPPSEERIAVLWGSSNGALYSLQPVRDGLLPWADLWMGWEDLGYGWLLTSRGYKQVVVPSAVTEDPYEHRTAHIAGVSLTTADKPVWYAYYFARNLLLVARRNTGFTPWRWAGVGARFGVEALLTATVRKDRRRRVRYLLAGVRDAVTGRTGKWDLP